jgi:hypothetical protein
MKLFIRTVCFLAALCLTILPQAAQADSLRWTGNIYTTDGRTFTPEEMATMTYYVRIDKPNPRDLTGRSGFNLPGTWYYIGETRNGITSWPSNNQLTTLLIDYGFAGQAVRFTVSQAFVGSDGIERDSDLSQSITWTSDATPPFVDTFSPDNAATGVPVGTTSFTFKYKDEGLYATGASFSGLLVNCPGFGGQKTCGVGLTCSGTPAAYTITYGGLSLGYDNVVSCSIDGSDLESPANAMPTKIYTFTVQSDPTPPVQITTTTLPDATVGISYSAPIAITGGQSPYSCDNTGVLPPGIPLSGSCAIGPGIPTIAGTYAFTVSATDAGSDTDNQAFTLTVLPAAPGGQTTTTALDNTDTYINSGSPSVNYADNDALRTYVWPGGVEANVILVKGSTVSLPDNVSVTKSTYRLFVTGHDGSGGGTMNLYVQPVAGTVSIDNVTWSNFSAVRGTKGPAVAVGLDNGWVEFDITAIVRAAYLAAKSDYVFSIGSGTGGVVDQNRIFASSEHATEALRPQTVTTYMQLVAEGGPSVPTGGKFRLGPGSSPKYFK